VFVSVYEGKTHSRERLESREDDDDDGVEGESVIGRGRKWRRRLEMGLVREKKRGRLKGTYDENRLFRGTYEVENDFMDEPGLSNLWKDIIEQNFYDDFADDDALCIWFIVLRGERGLEDMVYDLAVVFFVQGAVWRYGHVWLEMCKEGREGLCAARCIGGGRLCGDIVVVTVVLCDYCGYVVEDERREVGSLGAEMELA